MKKIIVIIIVSLLFSISIEAQEQYFPAKTSLEGRYEIVQSNIARRYTFKIDKYRGIVYQLVQTEADGFAWQEVPVLMRDFDEIKPDTVNYHIFMGGTAVKDCFLINIHTGITWVLVKSSDNSIMFEPFF
ncbi:MAG: hypothetical protein IJ328_07205 [Muribaculaceae bacterium]|nr:hypothetical protein [Muribaculaceae bacterium]